MIALKTRIQRLKTPEVRQREFNDIVRESLEEAGRWWIEKRLELHFGPSATRRYGRIWQNPKRTLRYLIKQAAKAGRRAELVELAELRRKGLVRADDPSPLESSGLGKNATTTRAASQQAQATAIATSRKQRLVITIPTGHPINPEHAGELSAVTQEEWGELRRRVIDGVRARMAERRRE